MKYLFVFLLPALFFAIPSSGQVLKRLGDKAKAKVEQRADRKVDQAMDKELDKAEGAAKQKDGQANENKKSEPAAGVKSDPGPTALSFNSKYDFVPGEKVVAFEDFSTAAIGDFPERWNTNVTAEVVTLNSKEGKWLKISKEGVFHPEFVTTLSNNFTLEFDLGVNTGWSGTHFAVNFAKLEKPQEFTDYYHFVSWRGKFALHLEFKPSPEGRGAAQSRVLAGTNGNHTVNNDVTYKGWDNAATNFAHVAIWRQSQRLRVYVNGEKIWDIPRAFDNASLLNAITFAMQGSYRVDDYFVLGNIRLAEGAADTRNKLFTGGKFVTRGILFDVNSDRIKPESWGALKDIGAALTENASVRVKIVGHTDADGDETTNLDLSKRRAAAVKAFLVKEFGIAPASLDTDGKGESAPVDKNTTAEGKANNRRVEFIKQTN